MADTVVGVCYRQPDQKEEVDEAFFRQLEVAAVTSPKRIIPSTSTGWGLTPAGEQLCREGPGSPGGQQADREGGSNMPLWPRRSTVS